MYIPSAYQGSEAQAWQLLRQQVLGNVVWVQDGRPQATPLPWLALPEAGELQAHLPRANPLVKALAGGPLQVLVSFQGPAAYISPNWYPSKAETERMVPTWNYAAVNLHGRLSLYEDPTWVRAQLAALTAQQEASEPRPWTLDDAAPGFIEQLQRVLVGLSLKVERIESKFKLNQHHAARDQAGMREGLARRGDEASLELLKLVASV